MAEITEDDLIKERQKVDDLRQQALDSEQARSEAEVQVARQIEMAQLTAEASRLAGVIDLNAEASKASTVEAGAAALLSTVSGNAEAPAPAPAEAPAAPKTAKE